MALAKSFALPPEQLFDWVEEVPLACGSVGQVHRAQLSEKGAVLTCCEPGEVVAVKVGFWRHRHLGEVL
jgi:aarF domain-containing kinase